MLVSIAISFVVARLGAVELEVVETQAPREAIATVGRP